MGSTTRWYSRSPLIANGYVLRCLSAHSLRVISGRGAASETVGFEQSCLGTRTEANLALSSACSSPRTAITGCGWMKVDVGETMCATDRGVLPRVGRRAMSNTFGLLKLHVAHLIRNASCSRLRLASPMIKSLAGERTSAQGIGAGMYYGQTLVSDSHHDSRVPFPCGLKIWTPTLTRFVVRGPSPPLCQ